MAVGQLDKVYIYQSSFIVSIKSALHSTGHSKFKVTLAVNVPVANQQVAQQKKKTCPLATVKYATKEILHWSTWTYLEEVAIPKSDCFNRSVQCASSVLKFALNWHYFGGS